MPAAENKFIVPFQIKAVSEDGTFSGYGSVFGVEDWHKEKVMPGAFAKSLAAWLAKGKMPAMLWQHNPEKPIGKYTTIREDGAGLYVEGKLLKDDLALAKEAYVLMKEGVVTGLSIGFSTKRYEWDENKETRYLLEVDLWEISLVTFPANESAQVIAVKAADSIKTIRQFEAMLRDQGFSNSEAVAIASKGFNAGLSVRDSQKANEADAGEPQNLDALWAALEKRGAIINGLTK